MFTSHGSIYWYFDTKESLFHALMGNEEKLLRRHVSNVLASSDQLSELAHLKEAVRATLEFCEYDQAVVKLLFRDSCAHGDRFEKHLFHIDESFISDIEVMVKDAQAEGRIIKDHSWPIPYGGILHGFTGRSDRTQKACNR
ncbi:MAG: TetR/AcrR family transcriptional regulator [Actinobacteria bacterium]|nr:TetR/AcrR family transcriptional regulator [Actinomycetota bacterium]MCL5445892.1 TetR/AcrR family transcriptional regulator [Actinomycetota bacterium]